MFRVAKMMNEMVPGKSFDRYHELGMVEVRVIIVYMITRGNSLKMFHDTMKTSYLIMILTPVSPTHLRRSQIVCPFTLSQFLSLHSNFDTSSKMTAMHLTVFPNSLKSISSS
ncbi:hypothetical protein G4B88_011414 [Cannabis sativa]|uniref:Uncharacterized protein n=1 Tax=Cannabis sativa TaxID=3483 RepID=A0A7J6GHX3_CANSA|nr:hypothetical protein G4B88_011414 [Cannabis sativa]